MHAVIHICQAACCCSRTLQPAREGDCLPSISERVQGGVFGAVGTSEAFIAAATKQLGAPPRMNGLRASALAVVPAQPYDYQLPLDKAAVIMIDFQRDFMLKGGFGDALGNRIELLQVQCVHAQGGARNVEFRTQIVTYAASAFCWRPKHGCSMTPSLFGLIGHDSA